MAQYEDMEEMIRLGAYRRGSDPAIDQAIFYQPALEAFLLQGKDESSSLSDGYERLADIFRVAPEEPAE